MQESETSKKRRDQAKARQELRRREVNATSSITRREDRPFKNASDEELEVVRRGRVLPDAPIDDKENESPYTPAQPLVINSTTDVAPQNNAFSRTRTEDVWARKYSKYRPDTDLNARDLFNAASGAQGVGFISTENADGVPDSMGIITDEGVLDVKEVEYAIGKLGDQLLAVNNEADTAIVTNALTESLYKNVPTAQTSLPTVLHAVVKGMVAEGVMNRASIDEVLAQEDVQVTNANPIDIAAEYGTLVKGASYMMKQGTSKKQAITAVLTSLADNPTFQNSNTNEKLMILNQVGQAVEAETKMQTAQTTIQSMEKLGRATNAASEQITTGFAKADPAVFTTQLSTAEIAQGRVRVIDAEAKFNSESSKLAGKYVSMRQAAVSLTQMGVPMQSGMNTVLGEPVDTSSDSVNARFGVRGPDGAPLAEYGTYITKRNEYAAQLKQVQLAAEKQQAVMQEVTSTMTISRSQFENQFERASTGVEANMLQNPSEVMNAAISAQVPAAERERYEQTQYLNRIVASLKQRHPDQSAIYDEVHLAMDRAVQSGSFAQDFPEQNMEFKAFQNRLNLYRENQAMRIQAIRDKKEESLMAIIPVLDEAMGVDNPRIRSNSMFAFEDGDNIPEDKVFTLDSEYSWQGLEDSITQMYAGYPAVYQSALESYNRRHKEWLGKKIKSAGILAQYDEVALANPEWIIDAMEQAGDNVEDVEDALLEMLGFVLNKREAKKVTKELLAITQGNE